jgi:type II secretory pathway component GspD/PulD (secretin)
VSKATKHAIHIIAAFLVLGCLNANSSLATSLNISKNGLGDAKKAMIAQAPGEAVPAPSDEEIVPAPPVNPPAPAPVPPTIPVPPPAPQAPAVPATPISPVPPPAPQVPAVPASPATPGSQKTIPAAQPEQKMAPAPGQSAPNANVPVPNSTNPSVPGQTVPVRPLPIQPVAPQPRAAAPGGGSSFFFDDADVFEVIQTVFGEVLRVNYVIDPQVKGRVNFRTNTPIPREQILPVMEIILRLNGIAVVEESGLYRIIQISNISKEPAPIRFGKDPNTVQLNGTAILQIVPLTFINSTEMTSIITPMLTQGGAIYDIPKKNILIIADTDANVKRLLQVTAFFDDDTTKDTTKPKIYVYPLQNSKAEHVSKILQQVVLGSSVAAAPKTTTTTGGAAPAPGAATPQPTRVQSISSGESLVSSGTKIFPDEVTNSLVIFASPADYALILNAIKQIDTIPRQVMIEAVVASVDITDNLTLGLRWNLNVRPKLQLKPFNRDINLPGTLGFAPLPDLSAPNSAGSTFFAYTAKDASGSVKLSIEADASIGKAKVLSSPNIMVADNREARIQVGKQIPLATSTTTTPISSGSTTTNTTTSTIQYKDTGTILKVKPQINDSGLISLEISQEVSSADKATVLGTDQFVITKNEVSTNLIAQDGETIVIGGLVTENKTFNRSGIPFFSKIPVLGYLFGQTTNDSTRQELIILLTPRVVRNPEAAKALSQEKYKTFENLNKEINLEKMKKTLPPAPMSPKETAPAGTSAYPAK